MGADQWSVWIVVNHSRREILIEAGLFASTRGPGFDDEPPTLPSCTEQRFAHCATCAHWDFLVDRMLVVGAVPVGDASTARSCADHLRTHVSSLAWACPNASQLLAEDYRVLGTVGIDEVEANPC